MSPHSERGMATAEYTVGTLGAVLIAAVLYKLGLLDDHNPWMEAIRNLLDRALGWGRLNDLFTRMPRHPIRFP
ncbi:DUF4244 domain-containing protein [Aeromicrobium sp.]|uniref:DUF4244 domain-containing protein n=1 Tax=Aeromicrobium sp. TaxID=1871063 RepID=UPI0030C58802